MERHHIKDFEDGLEINDYFTVREKHQPKKYGNKDGLWFPFTISDSTGTASVIIWGESDEEYINTIHKSFNVDDVILIKTKLKYKPYNGKLQVNLNKGEFELKKTHDFDRKGLVPRTSKDIPEMVLKFKGEIEAIKDNNIKKLLESIFDEDLMEKYSECPAAKTFHHNYIGGLLEHVLSMISLSKTISSSYEPDLDLDLLVAGCMLHDIGKLYEYEIKAAITKNSSATLFGHIYTGTHLVENKIDKLDDFPQITKNKILHMILSHSGFLEYGSPVTPCFPEAVALHMIDDCDAKVKDIIQMKKANEKNDTDITYGNRNVRRLYLR